MPPLSDAVLLALIATISPTIASAVALIVALRQGKRVDKIVGTSRNRRKGDTMPSGPAKC